MIEDIEYLNDNCEKDSATFYVDTNLRNRDFWPTPSEFSINFDQPFRLVNGFDVLDAAIPTTMYNIDGDQSYNAITIVSRPPLSAIDRRAFFKELTNSVMFSGIFEAKLTQSIILVCNPGVLAQYNINTQLNTVKEFTATYYVATRGTLPNVPISQQKYANKDSMVYIQWNDLLYGIVQSPSTQAAINILGEKNFKLVDNGSSETMDMVYFRFYTITQQQYEFVTNDQSYLIKIANHYRNVEEGNYDISTLRNDLNALWNDNNIFFENTTTVERKQGKYRIWSPNYIVYNAEKSGMGKFIGFDLLPSSLDTSRYETYKIGNNKRIYAGVYRPDYQTWAVLAPGIVNLLGERFVILRCKEIEDHLLGSFAYSSYTPGIGLFKLAASYNDITNLRFDFVNLVRKPFHPIGKLTKLTFRFEMASGELYDFKGVNIQMLLMLKFLVPTQKFKFEKSILNPNYDPNFMQYMLKHKAIQYQEDSDEEEEFNTDYYKTVYKNELAKHDYSSSEGEDEPSDEDSEEEVVLSRRRGNTN